VWRWRGGRDTGSRGEGGPPAGLALVLFATAATVALLGMRGLRRSWAMPAEVIRPEPLAGRAAATPSGATRQGAAPNVAATGTMTGATAVGATAAGAATAGANPAGTGGPAAPAAVQTPAAPSGAASRRGRPGRPRAVAPAAA